jgi:hypothetical protein
VHPLGYLSNSYQNEAHAANRNQYVPTEEPIKLEVKLEKKCNHLPTTEKVVPKPAAIEYKRLAVNIELKVELLDRDLWRRFNALGTEMIINKSGRFDIFNFLNLLLWFGILNN